MENEGITTAIHDRLLHKVEVIYLNGDSYRIRNRKTILGEESVQNYLTVTEVALGSS